MSERVILLPHGRIKPWPSNMRVRYPLKDVRRMALSQAERARQGLPTLVHAMIVTPGPGIKPNGHVQDMLYIVAGHLRHAGNVYLRDLAPQLNCVIRYYADEESMKADMRAENGVRSEITPLGWARSYADGLRAGKTPQELARESGKSMHHVSTCLSLLELSSAAQDLIDAGALPLGAIEHLTQIADKSEQGSLARKFAKARASVKTIESYFQRNAIRAGQKSRARQKARRPAVDQLPKVDSATVGDLRSGAQQACASCDIGRTLLIAEPAWHLALAAAGETCDCCSIRELKGACESCPLVEMMSRVTRSIKAGRP